MAKDLPAVTGNDRAVCTPKGFLVRERPITQKDVKNVFDNAALEKFSTKNMEEPTKDQLEFEQEGYTNIETAVYQEVREAARGSASALSRLLDRTVGPVEQRTTNTNVNLSLVEFLNSPDLDDATDMELQEAGIIIEAEVTDNEDYAHDL
jgi:hypothetical protein